MKIECVGKYYVNCNLFFTKLKSTELTNRNVLNFDSKLTNGFEVSMKTIYGYPSFSAGASKRNFMPSAVVDSFSRSSLFGWPCSEVYMNVHLTVVYFNCEKITLKGEKRILDFKKIHKPICWFGQNYYNWLSVKYFHMKRSNINLSLT